MQLTYGKITGTFDEKDDINLFKLLLVNINTNKL